jgi:hypothetical protein
MEFTDTLAGPMQAEKWGVATQNDQNVYLHIFEKPEKDIVFIPGVFKNNTASILNTNKKIQGKLQPNGIEIDLKGIDYTDVNTIFTISKK